MPVIKKLNGYTGWVVAIVAVTTLFIMGADRLMGVGVLRQQIAQAVKNDVRHDSVDKKHTEDISDLKVLAAQANGKLDTLLLRIPAR